MALMREPKRQLVTILNMRDNYLTTTRIENIIEKIKTREYN